MKLNENNELAQREPAAAEPLMACLARELVAAIPKGKERQQRYRVLVQLANAATDAGEGQLRSKALTTKEITTEISAEQEPSKLMARLWKSLCDPSGFPAMRQNLIRRCRAAGLSHFPEPRKEEGTPAHYYLTAEPLPPAEAAEDRDRPTNLAQEGVVRYEADMTLRLSRRGRLLFGKGLVWTARVRYVVAGGLALGLLLLTAIGVLTVWAFSRRGAPLSIGDLITTGMAIGVVYWVFRWAESVHLFEDRIVIAPQWALAWTEDGATLEIERAADGESPSTMHVRRYTAACPVCSGVIKVRPGEPEFPRRLVGRCEQSPREHVFGFDRITRLGARMPLPGAYIGRSQDRPAINPAST